MQIKQFWGEGESRTLSTKTMGDIHAELEIKISNVSRPHSSLCRAFPSTLSELYTSLKVLIFDFDKSTGHYGTANLMLKVTNKDKNIALGAFKANNEDTWRRSLF